GSCHGLAGPQEEGGFFRRRDEGVLRARGGSSPHAGLDRRYGVAGSVRCRACRTAACPPGRGCRRSHLAAGKAGGTYRAYLQVAQRRSVGGRLFLLRRGFVGERALLRLSFAHCLSAGCGAAPRKIAQATRGPARPESVQPCRLASVGTPTWSVLSLLRRSAGICSPVTMWKIVSAMLVAWSPMRSMFLAQKRRCVHGVMLR